MIDQIVDALGSYEPIICDGVVCTNWGQIAAYVLVIVGVYSLLRIIGKAVTSK